jgi:hypothetical protein
MAIGPGEKIQGMPPAPKGDRRRIVPASRWLAKRLGVKRLYGSLRATRVGRRESQQVWSEGVPSGRRSRTYGRRKAVDTNLGNWEPFHSWQEQRMPYGESPSYHMGADWLKPCPFIEDWGAGMGWFGSLVDERRYHAIDGSESRYIDEIADLTDFVSCTPGLFMRHVLEHNREWEKILDNAILSFSERMFLAIFTPLADETHEIAWSEEYGVPDISFRLEDLTQRFGDASFTHEIFHSPNTQYEVETVFRLEKR